LLQSMMFVSEVKMTDDFEAEIRQRKEHAR